MTISYGDIPMVDPATGKIPSRFVQAGPEGPQGDKGEKGDKGDKGDPGPAPTVSWNGPKLVVGGVEGPDLTGPQGGGAVDSVNGQTGEVVLGAGDVGARPAGDVPWGDVSDKPATYPPAPHTHTIGDVDGLQGALDDLYGAIGDVESILDTILEGTL